MRTESGFDALSIRRIREGYEMGVLTPRDVAELCIARTEALEERYGAWVSFDPEKLRAQARASAVRLEAGLPCRPLEGIPVGVKDIFNTVDFPTEMGSPLWKGFTPGNDARAVFHLRRAGAVLPGKTVTAEFAVHALLGATKNPHDMLRTPGTSSSGSAVAVALGMVPAALGTQTAGSLVRPASYCGVYCCKPSFGVVPRTGILKTTDTLDTVGFFVGHEEDLAPMFEALRVQGPNYPYVFRALEDRRRQGRPEGRPWRVALVHTATWNQAAPHAREALEGWGRRAESAANVVVEEAELPAVLAEGHAVHRVLYHRCLAYYFREEAKERLRVSPLMRDILDDGARISLEEYRRAEARQRELQQSMEEFFSRYDALVSLATAEEAPLRGEAERDDPALLWTLAHLPVVGAPALRSPRGLPLGLQVVARKYHDRQLLTLCADLTEAELLPSRMARAEEVFGERGEVR